MSSQKITSLLTIFFILYVYPLSQPNHFFFSSSTGFIHFAFIIHQKYIISANQIKKVFAFDIFSLLHFPLNAILIWVKHKYDFFPISLSFLLFLECIKTECKIWKYEISLEIVPYSNCEFHLCNEIFIFNTCLASCIHKLPDIGNS